MKEDRFVYDEKVCNILDHGVEITLDQAVKKLNDYEELRKRKNKEIAKFRKREEKYQSFVSGVMSFLDL